MIWLVAFMVNIAVFSLYRLFFMLRFSSAASDSERLSVLWSGMRLDLALLGMECFIIGFCSLAMRRITLRWLMLIFWLLAGIHAFACVGNYATFLERNESAGELLLPYILSPYQVYLAVMPFMREHIFWIGVLAIGMVAYFQTGWRVSRALGGTSVDLWRNIGSLKAVSLLSVAPLLFTPHLIVVKKRSPEQRGWKFHLSESKFFTRFSRHASNQAVINPVYELFTVQVPASMAHRATYHLSEEDALAAWTEASRRTPADPRHPLLTMIPGIAGSKIKNVVVIQVEGLSQSLIDHNYIGRPVMPFLRQIAGQGLYFPNAFQNVNFTSGGVFSTLTGIPKIAFEETASRFTSFEMNGNYGTLPRILGETSYTHYFCSGFRNSTDDFMAFSSCQGFNAFGYDYFKKSLALKRRPLSADTALGVADHEFLQECADLMLASRGHFTAHCMTCTSHSPFAVPAGTPENFDSAPLNAFAYLDSSVRAFCERLRANPDVWEQTLIVVTGDHTSIVPSESDLDHIRIPLIFHGPCLPVRGQCDEVVASQIDVLPTVLGMMAGEHPFAGFGRNLLEARRPDTGIVSTRMDKGMFMKDGYMLIHNPSDDEISLHAVDKEEIGTENLEALRPETALDLKRQYFSQIELAKRLSIAKRIFPLNSEGTVATPTKGF